MRSLLAILTISCAWRVEPWSLERLFTRQFIWGTPPSGVTWSKQGHALVFLWNAEGRRFLDLYSYNPDTQKLIRLTNLESAKDELNQSESEKDDRLKKYLLPSGGLSAFSLSRDGARVVFSHEGDLYATGRGTSAYEMGEMLTLQERNRQVEKRMQPTAANLGYKLVPRVNERSERGCSDPDRPRLHPME